MKALTNREKQVIECLIQGMTNKEIGHSLSMAKTTVSAHISQVRKKTESNTTVQAVIRCIGTFQGGVG